MTSIKIRMNGSREDKEGKYTLILQVIRYRRKRDIYTPYRLYKEEFDSETETLRAINRKKDRVAYIREATEYMAKLREIITNICNTLNAEKKDYLVDDVILMYKRYDDLSNVFVFTNYLVEELKKKGKDGTSANYKNIIRAFGKFLNNPLLTFNDLTPHLIVQYSDSLKQRGCMPNTIWAYLYQLRAIYNKAKAMGVVHSEVDPFSEVTLKIEKTLKRAIPVKQVRLVEQIDLSGMDEEMQLARDIFMFSFYTRGMSFVDMCYLKKDNLRANILSYRRKKTTQLLEIKVEQPLKELIDKYADPGSPYLLPLLCRTYDYLDYRLVQRRLNKQILQIGEILNFPYPLTFYIARHTWASMAQDEGIPVSIISSCMGHSSERTTRVYLCQINHDTLDKANKRVINHYKKKR